MLSYHKCLLYISDTGDFKEMLNFELQYQKAGQGSATFCTAAYSRSGHCLSSGGVWGPHVPAGSAAETILAADLI